MEKQQEELENQDIEISNNEKQVEISDLMKLFKELAEVQAKRTIVIAGKAGRDVKEGLNNKLQSVKNWVESEEKKYSAKQGEAKNIIKECTNTYNEIYAIYNETKNSCVERREGYQKVEQYEMLHLATSKNEKINCKSDIQGLKKEIKSIEQSPEYKQYNEMISRVQKDLQAAVKNGDTIAIEEINNKLKDFQIRREALFGVSKQELEEKKQALEATQLQIKLGKQNIKDSRNNIKSEEESIKKLAKSSVHAINVAKKEKDKQLAVIQKKNVILKLLDSVTAKVNGTKKFAKNVIEPLKNEIKSIKDEKIPNLKDEIILDLAEKEIKFNQFIDKTKENAKKAATKTKEEAMIVGETAASIGIGAAGIVVSSVYVAGMGVASAAKKSVETIGEAKDFVSDKITTGAGKVKTKARDIVDAGKEAKHSFLRNVANKIQNKVATAREDIEKKQANLDQEQEK